PHFHANRQHRHQPPRLRTATPGGYFVTNVLLRDAVSRCRPGPPPPPPPPPPSPPLPPPSSLAGLDTSKLTVPIGSEEKIWATATRSDTGPEYVVVAVCSTTVML